jgi:hypothetical protein
MNMRVSMERLCECQPQEARFEKVENIITEEIPDLFIDQLLFDIVTTNMIHGL